MWGAEIGEGKLIAQFGMAGECAQRLDRSFECQFAAISVPDTGPRVVIGPVPKRFTPYTRSAPRRALLICA
jgi:hypothetical protein